jgi:taurine dioxygenase
VPAGPPASLAPAIGTPAAGAGSPGNFPKETDSMTINVRPLGNGFAAGISGVDLSAPLGAAAWQTVYDAFLQYKVIAFHDQQLDASQFYAFGERFGTVEPHVVEMYRHPERPGITLLSNRVELGRPKGIKDAGSHWHSDYSYKQVPAKATMLYALETPADGGDTLFADLAAAYAALSPAMKQSLEGLRALHHYRWDDDQDNPEGRWRLLTQAERDETPEVVHPVVCRHTETAEQSIYVFPGITSGVKGIVGKTADESKALLQALYRHSAQENFQFRYKWRPGDVVVWDNRATMHCATTDKLPPDQFRSMWRINTTGTAPRAG